MGSVILDGTQFSTSSELHEQLKTKLKLPDFYGANLDALWDGLTAMAEMPLELKWVNYGISEQRLGADAERFRSLMEEAEQELPDFRFLVED
ncbi:MULTISPECIES: barstar family protein [Paenibacillus]|uniref:barstar family protein n=1 Tax=Paenibacillus TaxID=44249 RepID=UPI001F1B3366|nr:barstar family protein [Paenibacillus sp. JJ-223]CAH1211322.1 Barstar [Paenibacillus sp. JJ-223]